MHMKTLYMNKAYKCPLNEWTGISLKDNQRLSQSQSDQLPSQAIKMLSSNSQRSFRLTKRHSGNNSLLKTQMDCNASLENEWHSQNGRRHPQIGWAPPPPSGNPGAGTLMSLGRWDFRVIYGENNVSKYLAQGWRISGFEGARAPPERTGAPSHCQKHPLKTKEKDHKTSFKIDTQQRYRN